MSARGTCYVCVCGAVTSGTIPQAEPASVSVGWTNAGAMAESNAYNYEDDPSYKDPDDPARCVSASRYARGDVGDVRARTSYNTLQRLL